jgi:hypothetical protein
MHIPIKIISGGQTGVDRGALLAAKEMGITIGGWCPPKREAEDGKIPLEFALKETPYGCSEKARHVPRSLRTEWNVRDADATLILLPNVEEIDSGTQWTIDCCSRMNKAYLICDPFENQAVDTIRTWTNEHVPVVLNVAGPSESNAPGIQDATKELLKLIFSESLGESF